MKHYHSGLRPAGNAPDVQPVRGPKAEENLHRSPGLAVLPAPRVRMYYRKRKVL